MGKKSKSNKNYPLEFPPRDNRAENTPATDEVIEYEAMGVNSRHHSGVHIDNITEVITTEADIKK
ncbi:MAG: hypothetical protein Q3975_00160 [Oscillospiraceae bacterium]|nr:hypothetical protein [Oscillospiraceae bacterium]